MKSSLCLFIILICFSITFTGCGNTARKQAEQVITEYKQMLYSVPDFTEYNKISEDYPKGVFINFQRYVLQEKYADFIAERIPLMYYTACYSGKHNMKLDKITLTERSRSKDESQICFDYNAVIKLTYPETKQEKLVSEEGKITLIKEKTDWKIVSDDNQIPPLLIEEMKNCGR